MEQKEIKKNKKNIGNINKPTHAKAKNDVARSKIKKRSMQRPEEYGRKLHLLEWLAFDMC